MALAETANLAVKLTLGGNFQSQLGKVNRSLGTFDKNASRAYRAGQQIGTGIKRGAAIAAAGAGLIASQVALGLDSLITLEKQTAQTEAVLKSTGGAAGQTADSVRKLAEQYEALNATVGDEVIQQGENLILTYTNIRKQAFEPTLKAALDINTAMGKGPEGLATTIRGLGKALNDPFKATSLGKGVALSPQLVAQLKKLGGLTKDEAESLKGLRGAERDRAFEKIRQQKREIAQQLILNEVTERYGGSFEKQGGTIAGRVAKFTDSIEDLQRALAKALLPAIGNIADALTEFLSDPQTVRDVENLGKDIAKLFSPENIRKGIDALKDGFTFLKSVAGPIADVVGTAVKAFTDLPPDIQKLLVGGFAVNKLTGGLVSNIAGGIFGALKSMVVTAGVVNVNGGIVNGGGGLPGAAGGAAGAAGKLTVGGIVAAAAPLIAVAAAELAVADFIGPGLRSELGIPAGGKGGTIANIGGVQIKAGVSQAANAPSHQKRQLDDLNDKSKKTNDSLAQLKKEQAQAREITAQKLRDVKAAQTETKRETTKGTALINTSTRTGDANIVSAIHASRPIITVNVSANSVSSTVDVSRRYGKPSGSRKHDEGAGGLRGGR